MIIVVLQLNGTAVNVCMIVFGWLQERYTMPDDGDMLPIIFGCFAGAVPWLVTVVNLLSPKGPADAIR